MDGRGFAGGNYSYTNFGLGFIHLFVSIPRIAPIGGMIIEVKSTLQLQRVVLLKWKELKW
jgi:hypothetical protein